MKIISVFLSLIIFLSFYKCQPTKKEKQDVLEAEHIYPYNEVDASIKFYDDSTYTFNIFQKSSYYKKNEKYSGKYLLEKDTIKFIDRGFQFLTCRIAVINNGFVEFIGGSAPLKLKITETSIKDEYAINSLDSSYALFSYHPNYYDFFSEKVKQYSLKKNDVLAINNLLELCISENNNRITHNVNSYTKQCVAVTNANNEIEVIVYCNCKDGSKGFHYQITAVKDGGDCHFSVKLNLTKGKYSLLYINGSA